MRKPNKQSLVAGSNSTNIQAGGDVSFYLTKNVPTELVDQQIKEGVEGLRKSRFFSEFDKVRTSLRLGRRLADGDFQGGTDKARARALAWCSRLLCRSEEFEYASELLELAMTLGDCSEIKIAEAFISSQKENKAVALETLAMISTSASNSAGLMIVAHHDGAEGALSWMEAAGYTIDDLDPDGKSFLLTRLLHLGHWEKAVQAVDAISEADFEQAPVLHHLVALAVLVSTVPEDFRASVLSSVPFNAASFPLASDAASMEARRAAHAHFLDAARAAKQLACPKAERVDDEYALWLELRDPTESAYGKNRLKDKLRDLSGALGFVHYAIQFGVKLDFSVVEQEIGRSAIINGGLTTDAAIARFALAFTQLTPEEMASYIARYYDQLTPHIDAKLMRFNQIEMLSRSGLTERASEILHRLLEDGISSDQETNLRQIISEAEAKEPDFIRLREAKYKETGALSDLINLVSVLEDYQRWDDLCEFGKLLFNETRALVDAERLVSALNNTHRSGELVDFLNENTDLLPQSSHLRMSYAWGLYHEGDFLQSRAALAGLSDDTDSPNYRALQVNLGVATGEWASLATYISDEYQKRNERSAHDLIGAAQLAISLGSDYAKDLIFEAVARPEADPAVLASAYFIATSAGWENEQQIFQCLERAVELSGDDGPLQKMSLKDIFDQKPEWERRESETWHLLMQVQVPIFLTAETLGRTLIDLTIFPALSNLVEADPRRRSLVPAYSGKCISSSSDISGKVVALDAMALLTLSFLNILDVALEAFETVYVPHSTLGWLFEERQKAKFHQPSRIVNARKVRDFLATDSLVRFISSTAANSELSLQVSDELAELIAEAEKVRDDNVQHLVVRSAPVHRRSSLMEEEVDLSAHAAVLSSCLAVVEKLRQKGQLTADEERRARTYLQLHEKPWPDQPDIADGATLYLDALSVSYFLHLGLLGKLKAAGLTAVISLKKLSETEALISYDSTSEEVLSIIERIRAYLSSRIGSGHVKAGSISRFDGLEANSIRRHPSADILNLAPQCDALIIDDRFLNQYTNTGNNGAQAPILSTLGLLDVLVDAEILSIEDRLEHRTRLRRAGYIFIPVCAEELGSCLKGTNVVQDKVIETAELKAIRESVLCVRMSNWLQLPEEAAWLDGALKAFVLALKDLWGDEDSLEETVVRSNWLVEQIDVRGWAHSFAQDHADIVIQVGRAQHILLLLAPPDSAQQSVLDAYWDWLEGRILAPIKEQFPEVYGWLVGRYSSYVVKIIEAQSSEMELSVADALSLAPPLMRTDLIKNLNLDEGQIFNTTVVVNNVLIRRSKLYNAARTVLADEKPATLTDVDGRAWNFAMDMRQSDPQCFVLSSNQEKLLLPDLSVLSSDASMRIRALEKSALDVNLPLSAQSEWRCVLEERALEDSEVDVFHSDMRDTPVHVERSIRRELMTDRVVVSSLVPNSLRYFERLIGAYDGSESIRDYAAGVGRGVLDQLAEWKPYEGFLFSLLFSSHSALTAGIDTEHLDLESIERAFEFLENHGDILSRLAALEVGLRICKDRPEVKPFLLRLLYLIRDDDLESEASEHKLFSALFILVDGELARTRLLAEKPPFYRRLASLTHAALIHRQVVQCNIDYQRFSDWAVQNSGEHYYIQTLADMRLVPRWNPELAIAPQMQAEFFGRIISAGSKFQENLGEGKLRDIILGDGEQSLAKLCEFTCLHLPGPLDGVEESLMDLPDDLDCIVGEQLDNDEIEAASLIAFVNFAMIYRMAPDHLELAAKALRLSNHTLANLKDESQLVAILNGLATAAAVSRDQKLADELRILVRRYRRDPEYGFSIDEAIRICLVASASHENLNDWRQCVGEWLTEFAFGELGNNEGEVFYSRLLALLHSVPELWVSCSKVDAALQAWRSH